MMGKNVLFQFKYIAAFKMEELVALFAFHMDTVRMTAEAAGIFVTGACIFIYNEFFYFAAAKKQALETPGRQKTLTAIISFTAN